MWKTLALLAGFASATTGCGAAIYEPPRDASGDIVPLAKRVEVPDSFWVRRDDEAARTPPPERPRSISLGIAGQGKLDGGVGRDDPMPEGGGRRRGAGMSWQEYVSAPGWYTTPRGGYQPTQAPRRRYYPGEYPTTVPPTY